MFPDEGLRDPSGDTDIKGESDPELPRIAVRRKRERSGKLFRKERTEQIPHAGYETGRIKKTPLPDFANIRRNGIIAISLKKGDQLKWARLTGGADEVVLATRQGQSVRFDEKQIRPMGRTAAGVRAIRLKKQNDEVAGFAIVAKAADAKLLAVMENGFAKQTKLSEFKKQNRGGSGIKIAQITPKTGP